MLQMLDLPTLQERRKHQRLTLMYNIVGGHIPSLPPQNFLTPVDQSKRKIKVRTFDDCITSRSFKKYSYNNSKGFQVPNTSTEQYKCSFFVQTVMEWNKLEEQVVQATSTAAFLSAIRGAATQATR